MLRRTRLRICVFLFISFLLYYFIGAGDYIYAKNIDEEFDYPLNIDFKLLINEVFSGKEPSVKPINYYPHRFLTNSGKCMMEKVDCLILVKSAMKNFEQRKAIRETWGQEKSNPGRVTKTLFFLGMTESRNSDVQKEVNNEMAAFNDIIQIDFIDAYFNNTIKTMMAFRWAYQHCATANYYFFSDDDMYISINNLFKFLQNFSTAVTDEKNKSDDYEREKSLLAGYVFKSRPQRHRSSKWRVSLEEYQWNKWPPYVTAGAYVVTNKAMKTLYIGSLFVKHFRFDDIFLGIVAKKVGIDPIHCSDFYYYKKPYTIDSYKDVIASHGYGDPNELIKVWKEQD